MPRTAKADKTLRKKAMFQLPFETSKFRRLLLVSYQFEPPELLGHMKRFAHGRLPGDLLKMLGWPLATEQIHAQDISRQSWPCINRRERDPHAGIPDIFLRIDLGGGFE